MHLSELLSLKREKLMRRWTGAVRGKVVPERMRRAELIDHLPAFLGEVAGALRARDSPETSPTATEHGRQCFRLGFDLNAVVREYGVLRNSVLELACEEESP